MLDSTGLAIHGEGDWAASKHRQRAPQGYRKLHLGVDDDGVIVAQRLTSSNTDDASACAEFVRTIQGLNASDTGDAAYYIGDVYGAAITRRASVPVPPGRRAKARLGGRSALDRTIRRVQKDGRRRWKRESGYHRLTKAENVVFSEKTFIGSRMRTRSEPGRVIESVVACNPLNASFAMRRPESTPTCA